MAPKKVVKIMNQKGQKGNKVTVMVDERINKKGKTVVVAPQRGAPPSAHEIRAKKKAEQEAQAAQDRMLFKAVPTKAEIEAKEKKKAAKEAAERGEKPVADDPYAGLQEEDYRWTAEDFEPVEVEEDRLEEQLTKELEELREKLASGKITGTKVNPASFKKWKEQKRKEKIAADKKAKIKAIKTGALTGRMLYDMDESLFKDDEEAAEEYEREDEELRAAEEGDEDGAAKASAEDVDASLFAGDDLEVEDVDVQ